jgi:nicotinate dehydrogenase subunit B
MKADKFSGHDMDKHEGAFTLDRREFIKLLGGGIIIFFSCGDTYILTQSRQGRGYPEDFNAYLRIGEDGRVTCFSAKIEMGQGIITSLAQMLAEELDVPLLSIDMIMGDTAVCPWDSGTFGSLSTKIFGPPLRQAAAEARAVLLQLAAEKLKKPVKNLVVKEGVIWDKLAPEDKITFAQLTKGKTMARHLQKKPPIKSMAKHRISGKATDRTDSREKVTGEAGFAGDIRIPGMLYARILRPPAHGAKLINVDTSEAGKIKGVQIIQDNDLVAVLHEHRDTADKALSMIKARFESPQEGLNNTTIFAHLRKSAPQGEIVTEAGNLETGKSLAVSTFNATYKNHYVAHAAQENHTAVVNIESDRATVWASTQAPFRAQTDAASALGFPPEKVRVITPFVGGGFGGKTRNQQVTEAARLAKLTGKPVQVAWSRKEEFFLDTFRPAAIIDIQSGLNKNHKIIFWDYRILFAGDRSSEPFYAIPHHRVLSSGRWGGQSGGHPFGVGAWRGPGSNTNVFAIESQMDIMAEKAGMDPLKFRLHNLKDERMKRVLKAAAEKFNRPLTKAPSGRGYGVACTDYRGTYVAALAEVQAEETKGEIRVKRVVCAQDTGEIINPEGIRMQIEGCITMGLGYAFTEEIRFHNGEILDENFDTYEIPRFSWLPEIETVLIDNPEVPPQGCGEPAITVMGGLMANAVYDALGIRMFELPMTPNRIKAALKAKTKN